ncbi:MAG TPA: cyanophycinase [Saprospiraceae bacterium]|nr:cyanophycinase [Saprospiraceae bacterium]HRO07787.1 cyanophycinase [Saprospiraceae bacterium]HRP40987.1 cyanophycinase [Saprospiraceae bacterium]
MFNKFFCLIWLSLAMFISSDLFSQAIPGKGKLFIIGGGWKPPAMINRMVMEAGMSGNDYAVVLPMASEVPVESAKEIKDQFHDAGQERLYTVMFTQEQLTDKVKLDSVRNAKLIFISGGDQSKFISLIQGSPLMSTIHEAYRKGTLIAGTSAGAAMMSEIMITGNQLKDTTYRATFRTVEAANIETRRGLGLLKNAVIDQHFLIRSRHNRLLTSVLEHRGTMGIGIDESTAILVKGKTAEVIGLSQVLTFSKPKEITKGINGKYGVKNISVGIYLPGQRFKIGG